MADAGSTSQAGTYHAEEPHKHKLTSWITVVLIIVSSVVLGFAFVLQSLPLAIVGAVIGVAGVVLGITGKIMEDAH